MSIGRLGVYTSDLIEILSYFVWLLVTGRGDGLMLRKVVFIVLSGSDPVCPSVLLVAFVIGLGQKGPMYLEEFFLGRYNTRMFLTPSPDLGLPGLSVERNITWRST
jgi:hypothetical protein